METFFPSEIARLVLGYLKEEKCLQSWQTFLEESSNLKEYSTLYKKGKIYSTNVNGNSLLNILNEYCVLKFEAISNDNDKPGTSGKSYHDAESEILKTIKNDFFAETTKNAVDEVFQKYLSSVHSNRASSSSDLSPEVSAPQLSDTSCGNKERQKSYSTEVTKNSLEFRIDECDGKRNNNGPSATNEVKNNEIINKVHKQKAVLCNLRSRKSNVEKNITEKKSDYTTEQLNVSQIPSNISCNPVNFADSSSSKLLNLHGTAKAEDKDLQSSNSHIKCKNSTNTSGSVIRQIKNSVNIINDSSVSARCNRDLHSSNSKSLVENPSIASSEYIGKDNESSLTKSAESDVDAELKIIKEIKKDNLNNGIKKNTRGDSQSNQAINNTPSLDVKPVINIQTNNNVAVCNVQNKVTQSNDSKQKMDSSKNNSVVNIQVNNIRNDGINQTGVCNIQNKVNQINNSEHRINSSNDQASYKVNNSPLVIQPTPVNEMPIFFVPRYILPNYTSNGSFLNNNSQFYFVLNPPGPSNEQTVNGTIFTVPRFQTNNVPILPATPVNKGSSAMPTTAVSGISLAATNAQRNFLTVSNVSNPSLAVSTATTVSSNTLTVSNVSGAGNATGTISGNRKSQTKSQRAHTRVSYAEFTEDELEIGESNFSKVLKRKKTPPKGSPKKKTNRVSMNKKQNIDEDNFLILSQPQDVQNTSKRKKTKKKTSYKKKKAKTRNTVISTEQPVQNIKQHPEKEHVACPSDSPTKAASTNVIDHIIPVSSLSSSHSNSDQSVAPKTVAENASHSSILNDNRVLKIVLSDMFSECSQELNPLHHQYLDSDSDLVSHNEDNKDQVNDSEKLAAQSRRSPRIKSKENVKHLCESKNMDAVSVEQKEKVTNLPDTSESSNGRNESNKNFPTFDMATVVLNSMEQTVKYLSVSCHTNELNLQSSTEERSMKSDVEPTAKLTFQSVIQDICENAECVKLEDPGSDDGENMKLSAVNNSTLLNSQTVRNNLNASSTEEIGENCKNSINLIHHGDNGSIVPKEVTVHCENSTSVSGDSDPEKCSSLSQKVVGSDLLFCFKQNNKSEEIKLEQRKEITDQCENTASISGGSDLGKCSSLFQEVLEQNNETGEVISLEISKENLSDPINTERQVIIDDCVVEEEQRILPKPVSSIHCVNVNSRLKTVVVRKLNFGSNIVSDPVGNYETDREDMENSRNSSHCDIFKAGSDSFNVTNSKKDNPDFICQTSETCVFSALSSVSANTKVLNIAEKPHSEITETSSISEENVINGILPSTSKQPSESQKCVLVPAVLSRNLMTKCDEMDNVTTGTCSVEENNTPNVILSSSISEESMCTQKCDIIPTENPLKDCKKSG